MSFSQMQQTNNQLQISNQKQSSLDQSLDSIPDQSAPVLMHCDGPSDCTNMVLPDEICASCQAVRDRAQDRNVIKNLNWDLLMDHRERVRLRRNKNRARHFGSAIVHYLDNTYYRN
jgi:hypothetical protein